MEKTTESTVKTKQTAKHTISPIYDAESEILILGSFPSVKSRESNFFYAHKQNRFWKVLANVLKCNCPETVEEKKKMLFENRIAVWDVIKSCTLKGSSDSEIENVEVNDITLILKNSSVKKIFANGGKSYELYMKHIYPITMIKAIKLPSTSSANASWSMKRLTDAWGIINE